MSETLDVEPTLVKRHTPIRLDGSRWWHYPYVLPVVDRMPGPERKLCAPYDGVHLFALWEKG